MSTACFPVDDIAPELIRLAGRPVDDPALQDFLLRIEALPLPALPSDEFFVAHCDVARGFELQFQDAAKIRHAAAEGRPARTLLLIGGYFHAEGHEGFTGFRGHLPFGVTWQDSVDTLRSRLGEPKNTIVSKKTGVMTSQRWAVSGLLLTVGYRDGAIEKVYVGII